MIYRVIRTLLRWFMRFFYPRVFLLHSESIPKNKPFILVCNHRNSFMDAFVLALQFDTPLYFIKPFKRRVGMLARLLMENLHIVPLRKGWHRNSSHPYNPWANLRNLIANNKPLVFFSEPQTEGLKVTKGAAKIAFHTEEVFDFGLDIEIIPVTIHYGGRGDAVIILGQSVPVKSFEKDYKRFPARTIKYTTNYLEDELISGMVNDQAELAHLLGQFRQISLRKSPAKIVKNLSIAITNPVSNALNQEHPRLLRDRLFSFYRQLGKLRMNDWSPPNPGIFSFLLCIVGAPVFVLGYSINWLRYELSKMLSIILLPGLQQTESSKVIIGLFLFPSIWLLISGMVYFLYNSPWLSLGILAALPLLAHFTYIYAKVCKNVASYIRYLYCLKFRPTEVRTIEQTYAEILYLLRKASTTEVFST